MTADDYRALPEDGRQYQLIEGDLVVSPAPNRFHQDIVLNICRPLADYADSHGGAVYLAPFDVFLDELNVLQPDVLYVGPERAAGVLVDEGAHAAPDLAVEVLSPSTATRDKTIKRSIYARHGLKELWLVDPLLRQIQVYRLQEDPAKPVEVLEDFEVLRSTHFDGLEIPGEAVFRQRYK
jgi:Uma2 family endonuclease